MNDEERQAQALRQRLDRELAAVQATAQARERLVRATTARTWHSRTRTRRPLRPALALPLAGALAAAVIAITVAVPTFLQTDSGSGTPAGAPGPGRPLPPVSATPNPEPTPTPTVTPASEAVPGPTPTLSADSRTVTSPLKLSVSERAPAPRQRIALTMRGVPTGHGQITIQWGDGTSDTLAGRCSPDVTPREMASLPHRYPRVGSYRLTVTVDRCGTRNRAGLTVNVQSPAEPTVAPAATPSPAAAPRPTATPGLG
jgi:hypothetical protein